MADELFERFRDILHEIPEIEVPLRAWRDRQARGVVKRQLARRRTENLIESLGGYEPGDGETS